MAHRTTGTSYSVPKGSGTGKTGDALTCQTKSMGMYQMRKASRRRGAGALPPLAGLGQNWAHQSLTHPMVKQVSEVLIDPTDAVKSWLEKLLSQVKSTITMHVPLGVTCMAG
jgi:hypothetical protein